MDILKQLAEYHKEGIVIAKSATNPFYKNRYATLDDINKVVSPVLGRLGLVVYHQNITKDDKWFLRTICQSMVDQSYIDTSTPIDFGGKAQEMGSNMTYLKRYNIGELLNIATEEDDDGNAASGKVDAKKEAVRTKPVDDFDIIPQVNRSTSSSTTGPKKIEPIEDTSEEDVNTLQTEVEVADKMTKRPVVEVAKPVKVKEKAETPSVEGIVVDMDVDGLIDEVKKLIGSTKDRASSIAELIKFKTLHNLGPSITDPVMIAARQYLDSKHPDGGAK